MSIVGNLDKLSLSNKYNLSTTGVLVNQGATGATTDNFNGTSGATAVKAGDAIFVAGTEYLVQGVLGPTSLQVGYNIGPGASSVNAATGFVGSTGNTVFVQESPKYVKYVNQVYGNTASAQRSDVYGVSAVEEQVGRNYNNHPQHMGWVRHVNGYGPITGVTVTNPGWYYGSTGPTVTFSTTVGATGVITATGYAVMTTPTVTAGATGCTVASVVITNGGLYTTVPTNWVGGATGLINPVTVTFNKVGSTGIAATGSLSMGGRFGRNLNETLVALNTMIGDTEDVIFPNS